MHDHQLGNILGLATLSSACDLSHNNLWTTNFYNPDLETLSETFTHEIGHSLSLTHVTNRDCPPYGECIMYSTSTNVKGWENSSKVKIKDFLDSSRSFCLTKQTKHALSNCGDGVVVEGEECDCGAIPQALCNKKCCDETCHFTRGSQCSTGMCCDIPTCQLEKKGSLCIRSDGECQENIVCDGKSSHCLNNFTKIFTKCKKDDGYCYKGKCRSLNQACKDAMGLFGNKVVVANDLCYILGNQPYSAEYFEQRLRRQKNAKCGVLLCDMGRHEPSKRTWVLKNFTIEAFNCTFTDIEVHENYENLNPMYVPEGTKCGDNKVCNAMNCVPIEEFVEGKKPFRKYLWKWWRITAVIFIAMGMSNLMYNLLSNFRSNRKNRNTKYVFIKEL